MGRQDILDAHSEGFDDGYNGYFNANPYATNFVANPNEAGLCKAYQKGYREGIAKKEREWAVR